MDNLKELIKDTKTFGKYVTFWGSCFSNFYPCSFDLDGRTWNCSEQYFMYMKAKLFGDEEIAEKILQSHEAADAKKLGRKVKNFDADTWSNISRNIMYAAVYSKFSQNQDLKDALLYEGFADKHFVEGNPFDKIWAVGLPWDNPLIGDERNWHGTNWLGKILDEVREKLKEKATE